MGAAPCEARRVPWGRWGPSRLNLLVELAALLDEPLLALVRLLQRAVPAPWDCKYAYYGCANPAADNYLSFATHALPLLCMFGGCPDSAATNFDANATFHDAGACKPAVAGCTDPHAENFVSVDSCSP